MKLSTIEPKSARIEGDSLVLEGKESLASILADGCFFLRQPDGLDLSPGITLARNFYKQRTGSRDDDYRGLNTTRGIYFDRDLFQTEHLMMDRTQRVAAVPTDVVDMCDDMAGLGRIILKNVLQCLNVPQHRWSAASAGCLDGDAVEWMAVSHYRSNRRQLGCPAHKDTGYITILYFEREGLEAMRAGHWHRIDPRPGHFLVNFGGALERLTRRLDQPVEALLHRVAECKPDPSLEDRFSFAAFINPPAAAMLCELEPDGTVHEVEKVEDFLHTFNEQTWKDSYADFGISKDLAVQEAAP